MMESHWKDDHAHERNRKQVIDSLPNDATMDDIIHALYINVKFARGEQEIREGKGVTHEEAKRKREKWLR